MRRPLILLVLLALAAPAAAQEKTRGHIRVIPPSPLSRLRAPTSPEALAAQTAAAAGATPLASPVPLAAMTPPLPFAPQASDPAQCRIGCAQSYYFCLAGDDAESCAPAWGQCRAACTAPQLGPSVPGVMR
jgi:hypothetical protein